jgi:hypothetical protein
MSKTLDNFGGFDSNSHDFFGEKQEVEVLTAEEIVEKVTEDKVTEDKEEIIKAEKAEDKATDDQFKEFDASTTEDDDDDDEDDLVIKDKNKVKEEKKEPTAKVSSMSTIEFLKEKGLVSYELEEGAEMTEDLAQEILEGSWEDSIQDGVADIIKDLPDAVKDLVKFASQGGNVTELLSKMSSHARTGLDKDSDMSEEANQIIAVTLDLQSQEYDEEDIAAQIDFLRDSGKLENYSTKAYKKLLVKQEAERKAGIAENEANKVKNKRVAKEYKEKLSSHLSSVENFKGIVINKKDKENLPSYIADLKVPLQNGTTVSKFQADLFAILGDESKLIGLAKIINSDFDFSSISNKTITEFSKKTQASIENSDKINLKGSSASSQKQKKSLADLLD